MKDIPGYEGLYAATTNGQIWSYRSQKFLKPELLENGYHRVCLSGRDGRKRFRVHTLVAMTYIDNPFQYNEVNHIDGDKINNCVSNLEWCSHKYNIHHYLNTLCKNF